MKKDVRQRNYEVLSLISELCQVVRCCRQDAVLYEDVTFTQFLILDHVAMKGDLKMSELNTLLAVDKSTTTRLVNPLVRQGLLERAKSDHDSRAVNLKLTNTGKDVHQKVWGCLNGFVNAIGSTIPDENKKDVYEAVKLFINAVKNASSICSCSGKS
ncbi:MAG: MarR family transcriptional regulator [Syntrophaceae bacterium]